MKTFIKVKLVVEGIHYYPTANRDYGIEVDYLRFGHRHNFVIECTMAVSHSNRDKEFLCMKHDIQDWLKESFYDKEFRCLNFESMSCEQIGEKILYRFNCDMVEVSEDGENSAIVMRELNDDKEPSKEEQEKNKSFFRNIKNIEEIKDSNFNIQFMIGPCFAGKSFFINNESFRKVYKDYKIIEVGDIVRRLSKQAKRVCDKNYDMTIVAVILDEIIQAQSEYKKKGILIVGLRQLSIFKSICQTFKNSHINIMLILAEREVRQKRFELIKNDKKNIDKTFDEIDHIDYELGLYDLITYILTSKYSFIISNSQE